MNSRAREFGAIKPEWYVFPFGSPQPLICPPCDHLGDSVDQHPGEDWREGRWHDTRHTLIAELAESGAGDQTIMDIAGHVSKQILKHYSPISMKAKYKALETIVPRVTSSE